MTGSARSTYPKRKSEEAAPTLILALAALFSIVGCGGGSSDSSASNSSSNSSAASSAPSAPSTSLSATAQLGEQLFGDTSLSVSGQLACITCHSPASAFGGIVSVQLGGPNMDIPGIRKAPSIMYASFTPPFSIAAGTPTGGLMRDGRASSLALQAEEPFITSFEMANATPADVIARLKASPTSVQEFEQVYGQAVLSNPAAALQDMGLAIAAYQTEATNVFQPFTSKFDYWLLGQAQLTAQEQQGLTLFNDPGSGNCAACHPSQVQSYSTHPLFTNFTYDNIGVPRNWAIPYSTVEPVSPVDGVSLSSAMPAPLNVPANAEYNYYDLGLCGPFKPPSNDPNPRPDLSSTTSLCGFFKVPSLRNVALTAPYFHNGVFNTLLQVLQWSVTRNINNNAGNNPYSVPAGPNGNPYEAVGTFYTAADGTPDLYQYNDLPTTFDGNVIIGVVPYTLPTFAGGQAPTLSEQEMDDIIAFLCTLTDGYNPSDPAAYSIPAQCLAAEAAP